jgi:hypothetical protein
MPRRPRSLLNRSENDAHERPRAARSGRIRSQAHDGFLEGAGSHRALRSLSHRTQDLGRREKIRNRRAHRARTRRRSEIRRGIATASGGNCRTGRLLRRLPHDRSGMAPPEKRSDAARVQRASHLESCRLRRFQISCRPGRRACSASSGSGRRSSRDRAGRLGPSHRSVELERRDKAAERPPQRHPHHKPPKRRRR